MKIKLNDGKTGDVDYATAQHMISAGHATEVHESTPPARNANTDAWRDYARTLGATDEDLEGRSRAELIAEFGGEDDSAESADPDAA